MPNPGHFPCSNLYSWGGGWGEGRPLRALLLGLAEGPGVLATPGVMAGLLGVLGSARRRCRPASVWVVLGRGVGDVFELARGWCSGGIIEHMCQQGQVFNLGAIPESWSLRLCSPSQKNFG